MEREWGTGGIEAWIESQGAAGYAAAMSNPRLARDLDQLSRDLDMVVFRLERSPPDDLDAVARERKRLRRELESIRTQLEDLARDLS